MNCRGLLEKLTPVAGCLLLVLASASFVRVQSPGTAANWEKAAGGKMAFEVVSVKQDTSGQTATGPHSNVPLDDTDAYTPTGGLLSITNLNVSNFISFAYKIDFAEGQRMRADLPKWARQDYFDVEARGPANATKDQMRLMMRSLLADRFQLAAHFETHDRPIYELVLAKPGITGPQLTAYSNARSCVDLNHPSRQSAVADGQSLFPCGMAMALDLPDGGFRIYAGRVTIQEIADDLSIFPQANIDRPVVNRTGLTGYFDFAINLPKGMRGHDTSVTDNSVPSFVELLEDQLGLKLKSGNGPVESLIIDHIEEPTPN